MSSMRNGLWIGLTILAVACGGGNEPAESPATPAGENQTAPAATLLALPGEAAPSRGGSATVGSGPLSWSTPEGWIEETPRSMMRRAQYRVPGEGGDGECIVFYFGPGQGGDPQANAARWAGQFTQPDGSSSLDAMSVSRLDGGSLPIQLVEVRGTYDGGMTMTDAPAQSRPGHMLLGGIAMAADAPWFFKFTGPEETIEAQRRAFEGMLESLHVSQ